MRSSVEMVGRSAILSACGKYRYVLQRAWDVNKPRVVFVGLNPSIADANLDDATICRCINYAHAWGGGELCMLNLFAFRTTYPYKLFEADDPIGELNNGYLRDMTHGALHVVAAWGEHGSHQKRDLDVWRMLDMVKWSCLRRNRGGAPSHPLRLPATLTPKPFEL